MIKYRKIFQNKIKSLFLYLINFFKNNSRVPKKYFDDYVVNK